MKKRVFKSAWFAKAAMKAHIEDDELCSAILQVMSGQADDLGGGVFKKRLDRNKYRSVILAKAGHLWIYEYLFAKKDRSNIGTSELTEFRNLAKAYATLTGQQVNRLLLSHSWTEICHENQG